MSEDPFYDELLRRTAGLIAAGGPEMQIGKQIEALAPYLKRERKAPTKPLDDNTISRLAKDNPQLIKPNPLRRVGRFNPPR
jgi:hypothetical protein